MFLLLLRQLPMSRETFVSYESFYILKPKDRLGMNGNGARQTLVCPVDSGINEDGLFLGQMLALADEEHTHGTDNQEDTGQQQHVALFAHGG